MTGNKLDQTIFDVIPIPAFVVDDDVTILEINRSAIHFCGQDREAVSGRRVGDVLHCFHSTEGCGTSAACHQCVIRNSVKGCLRGQTVSRARMTMDFLPGAHPKTRELLVSASPICDGKTLAVLVVEDVTLNAKLEQALRRSEKLAVTGRLTTAIVHEINNPLQALENFLHLLGAEPGLSDSSVELVELAKREVARLVSISRQTLVPHREAKLPVCTRASEVLDEVIAVFDRRLESARIEVRREYQTDGEVLMYPGELRQVFTNLIENAIDAIGYGGEIHLSIQESPRGEVIVRVCDNGCGIPPEHLDAIFEPFFTTKGEKGTGIGLWVIRGILANAGGKIEVQSSTTGNPGTCFSVYLPTEA